MDLTVSRASVLQRPTGISSALLVDRPEHPSTTDISPVKQTSSDTCIHDPQRLMEERTHLNIFNWLAAKNPRLLLSLLELWSKLLGAKAALHSPQMIWPLDQVAMFFHRPVVVSITFWLIASADCEVSEELKQR